MRTKSRIHSALLTFTLYVRSADPSDLI